MLPAKDFHSSLVVSLACAPEIIWSVEQKEKLLPVADIQTVSEEII